MNFADAVRNTEIPTVTENGMGALESSLSPLVDLFYKVGANRGQNLTADFERAFQANPELAIRMALWVRDVRGGAGERKMARDFLLHLEDYHSDYLLTTEILSKIPEVGRFDDLLIFKTPAVQYKAFAVIKAALEAGNGLAAKWLPRKGEMAVKLRSYLGYTPKQYRKTLVNLTKVVETQMCRKEWDEINFSHVPSKAMTIYTKAFKRNAPGAFEAYKAELSAGTAKVNASGVYPYNVVKYIDSDRFVADKMWDSLPNYMTDANVLPMVDVSGSMETPASGISSVTCMDIALSLGLYCSDKNKGSFKDMFLTFSGNSKIEILKGSLSQKLAQLRRADWGMNTNLERAFDAVLNVAVRNKVSEAEMPKIILILSDMQFDAATRDWGSTSKATRAIEMARSKYANAGYEAPKIVFWNLAGNRYSNDNVPVRFDETGTALVSGFSPSIMQAILAADLEQFTPENIMKKALMSDRYDFS